MKKSNFVEKFLILILIVVVTIIATTTIYVFATSKENIGKSYRKADPSPQKVVKQSKKTQKLEAYTELGDIRTVTKAPLTSSRGTTVLITPWFSYQGDDKAFYEELNQKSRLFRSLISEYFTQYTYEELKSKGEDSIKQDILRMINNQLVLNSITAVYFEKFIFFE